MAVYTYSFKIGERTISVKAKKAEAERISRDIRDVTYTRNYLRRLSGVRGVSESASTVMRIGGRSVLADEAGFEAELKAYIESLPAVLTPENVLPYWQAGQAILKKHMPVEDTRQTPEERLAEEAETARIRAERDAADNQALFAFLDEYAAGRDRIQPPAAGMVPITLTKTFDNSDGMTDYYCPHSPIGPTLVLAWVHKGVQKESVLRDIVRQYPQLSGVHFTWHTEKHSGGHGNYLMSDAQGRTTVGKGKYAREVVWNWEVEWGYCRDAGLYPAKGYRAPHPLTVDRSAVLPSTAGAGAGAEGVSVARNYAHNGIEVRFAAKPDEQTLIDMRVHGFKWSPRQKLWYAHFDTGREAWANARFNVAPEPEPSDPLAEPTAVGAPIVEPEDDEPDSDPLAPATAPALNLFAAFEQAD